MKKMDLLVIGVGGQGVVLASDVIGQQVYGSAWTKEQREIRELHPGKTLAGEATGFAAAMLGPGALTRAATGGSRAAAAAAQRIAATRGARAIRTNLRQDVAGQLAAWGQGRGRLARPFTAAERLAADQAAWARARGSRVAEAPKQPSPTEGLFDVDWAAAAALPTDAGGSSTSSPMSCISVCR